MKFNELVLANLDWNFSDLKTIVDNNKKLDMTLEEAQEPFGTREVIFFNDSVVYLI